jgi:membrane associated rhomboid family serine protease
MGSGIEYGIHTVRMAFLYIICGIGGITLSMCVRPSAKGVGASTAVFGLVGFYVAYIFTHWRDMGRKNKK